MSATTTSTSASSDRGLVINRIFDAPAPIVFTAWTHADTLSEGLAASGYFFPLLKIAELVCAIMLLTGRFVPLALVILSPIIVKIFMVHLFLDRSGLPVAIFLVGANIFLAYCYRDAFKHLLTPNYTTAKQ